MNKAIFKIIVFVGLFMLNVTVNAQSNVISKEQIENYIKSTPKEVSDEYIKDPYTLSANMYDEDGNVKEILDFDTMYIKTTTYYSGSKGNVVSREEIISEEEYNNASTYGVVGNCQNGGIANDCWETSAKKLSLFVYINNLPYVNIHVLNQWKTIPAIKSYDTIGLLYRCFTAETAYGFQKYNTSSNTSIQTINYSYEGTNMKVEDGGISISQNIVDDVYSHLENQLWVEGYLDSNWYGQFAASYQHATTNITLATSKNFSFSISGMGNVFLWNESYSNWDNMQGVCSNNSDYLWIC